MKKITTLFMMLLAAVMTLSMSSCTEDQEIGMTLEGTWEGYTHAYHEYNGQRYQSNRTVLTFGTDLFRFTQGTGYWVDYYSDYGWGRNYIANHIDWKVKGGIIYIHFREDHYDIEIHDYRLYNDHFVGTIYTSDSNIDFSLYKTSDRNWNDYDYGYYGPYYSKGTRAGSDKAVEAPKRMFIPDAEE
ncbi:MAG: hepatitis A virus cellular receptor 1 [Prevotella sp.]|nr:hepatitis A virus cellular receptor 1 [Prevotella sp.]MBR7049279.1 hepatitis A virus cellular receptor 1 [Prevotella sp.]